MNIVYSSSDSYAEICGISLVSLFENNKEVCEMSVFIIDNDISHTNKQRLIQTGAKYGRSIYFLNKLNIEKILDTKINVGRWNIGTFFRLYLPCFLPSNIDKVLYIDCDTVIRHELESLYKTDLGNCIVAGVDDCRSGLYRKELGLDEDHIYINNGFLLIDLKKWKQGKVTDLCSEYIKIHNGDLTYMDQTPLNSIVGRTNQIYELPAKYNAQRIFFDFKYKELIKLRKPTHCLSLEEYENCINNPIVVHFTPTFLTGTRPWQKKDNHIFKCEYLKYKEMSEWKNEPLRNDDRKFLKKVMTFVCKISPRFFIIFVMSYLHSTWYPKKRFNIAIKNIAKSKKEKNL